MPRAEPGLREWLRGAGVRSVLSMVDLTTAPWAAVELTAAACGVPAGPDFAAGMVAVAAYFPPFSADMLREAASPGGGRLAAALGDLAFVGSVFKSYEHKAERRQAWNRYALVADTLLLAKSPSLPKAPDGKFDAWAAATRRAWIAAIDAACPSALIRFYAGGPEKAAAADPDFPRWLTERTERRAASDPRFKKAAAALRQAYSASRRLDAFMS